jgi:gentisate 1,2-dioxygenase
MNVDQFIDSPWNKLALYTLTEHRIKEPLYSTKATVQGWIPAHHEFPEHAHGKSQMHLVTRRGLTHISKDISYTQVSNDILIVPAKLKHHAHIGDEEIGFILVLKVDTN